jgi:hypothetical protein
VYSGAETGDPAPCKKDRVPGLRQLCWSPSKGLRPHLACRASPAATLTGPPAQALQGSAFPTWPTPTATPPHTPPHPPPPFPHLPPPPSPGPHMSPPHLPFAPFASTPSPCTVPRTAPKRCGHGAATPTTSHAWPAPARACLTQCVLCAASLGPRTKTAPYLRHATVGINPYLVVGFWMAKL